MQLVLIAHVGPALFAQLGNRGRIEPARFAQQLFRNHAAHAYGAGAALFQRCIVEEGVRIGIQQLMGEGGGGRAVDCETANRAGPDAREQLGSIPRDPSPRSARLSSLPE